MWNTKQYLTALADATNVNAGIRTSSPGSILDKIQEM